MTKPLIVDGAVRSVVLPTPTLGVQREPGVRNAELTGHSTLLRARREQCVYLPELGGANLVTTWTRDRQAPLAGRVLHVVALRAEEEMRRINAGWNIAMMEHRLAGRNRPIGEHPRDPVGIMRHGAPAAHAHLAVAVPDIAVADPQPASVSLVYLSPEPGSICIRIGRAFAYWDTY